jgi:tetratricopeptide (TPR) repeat protein
MRAIPFAVALALQLACDTPDPDLTTYRRAHELTQAGAEAEARALYQQLLRPDGGSRFTADAHLALAELDFLHGDLDAALEHYRAVVARGEATRPYALYKIGWCWLNKNEPARAMEAFQAVTALPSGPGFSEERRKEIGRVARRDLAKAYALADKPPEKAADYFERLAGAEAPELLERLAEGYGEKGRWREAAATLRELIAGHVDSPRLCEWQGQIVRATLATGGRREQLSEMQRLGAVLARLESNRGAAAAEVESCRQKLRDVTKEQVLVWHKDAQKTKDPSIAALADPLYRQYLARFPKEKDAYEMTFYHAELLWTLGRWREAHDEYRRVVEMNPRGKLAAEAAYATVLSAKNALEAEPAAPAPAGLAPQPFSPAERRLLAAFDLYLATVAKGEVAPIKYRRARMYYDHNQLAAAVPLFQELALHHPESELAIYAANLALDSLNALKQKPALCAYLATLVGGPLPKKDGRAASEWRKIASQCGESRP